MALKAIAVYKDQNLIDEIVKVSQFFEQHHKQVILKEYMLGGLNRYYQSQRYCPTKGASRAAI